MKHLNKILCACAATLVASNVALAQIPRKDVLECAFADGSKVILESRYLWYPINPNPRSTLDRTDQGPYKVYYKLPRQLKRKEFETTLAESRLYYRANGLDDDSLIADCAIFKKINGVLSAPQDLYFDRNGVHYKFEGILPALTATQEATIATLKGFLWGSPARILKGKLIYQEHPVVAEETEKVIAVVQSESHDLGNTWKVLGVTTDARIYIIGKTVPAQNFVARPTRVNGNRFILQDKAALIREQSRRNAIADKKAIEYAKKYAQSLEGAIVQGDWNRFEQLLNSGVNINAPTGQDGRLPLLVALDKPESAPFALALINRGANLTPVGLYEGVNVLMLAAGNSTPEVMKALLAKQKFDVNQHNPNGATALSYAVAGGRIENVRLLLELGADTQIKTSEGSLIDIAHLQGHTEIVKLLERRKR